VSPTPPDGCICMGLAKPTGIPADIRTKLREWAYGSPFTRSFHGRAALPAWLLRYGKGCPNVGLGGAAPITRLRSTARTTTGKQQFVQVPRSLLQWR
jgi:hypothetical protein